MIGTRLCGYRPASRAAVCLAAGLALGTLTASPVFAQLVRVDVSKGIVEPGGTMRGPDIGFDPVNGVDLLVTGNGPVYGAFVNSA